MARSKQIFASDGQLALSYSPDFSIADCQGRKIALEPSQRVVCRVLDAAWQKERQPVTLSLDEIKLRADAKRSPKQTPGRLHALARMFGEHPFWDSVITRGLGENGRLAKDIYCYDPCVAPAPDKPAPMSRARKAQLLR
jgi:hypothetical protein